jgi:hypothetical protein
LLRRRKVEVMQDQMFGDILITPLAPELQPEGAAMDDASLGDDEESVFEIPKAQPEGETAEEFEFEVVDGDQDTGESTNQGINETARQEPAETVSDGSTVGEDQPVREPSADTPAGHDQSGNL